MVGNIVIALHGDISARAVPFAEGIAQRWGGHLVVLHAIGRGAHTSHPAWVDLHPVVQQPRDSGIRWRGCGACGGAITGDRGRRARSRRSSTVLGRVRGCCRGGHRSRCRSLEYGRGRYPGNGRDCRQTVGTTAQMAQPAQALRSVDGDFEASPILASVNVNGRSRDMVIGAGKAGYVVGLIRQADRRATLENVCGASPER